MVLHGGLCGRVERCQVMWLDSSVGRAEDWKSSCPWFDSWSSHQVWRYSQVVRQRSAKPLFPGSNPGDASKKLSFFWTRVFLSKPTGLVYHHALACISSTRHCRVVSHHTIGVYKKLSAWWYTKLRFDDMQFLRNWWDTMLRIDFTPLLCYNTLRAVILWKRYQLFLCVWRLSFL